MASARYVSAHAAAGYILMVSVFSAALLSALLFFLPQFVDLYYRAGLSVPFLTVAFVSHRDMAVVWLAGLGCLLVLLPLTNIFRRTPQVVVTSVLVVYAALMGTIALSLCMPLIELMHRVG